MVRNKKHKTVVKGVSLRPIDWATIDAHAKDEGLISRSAGLRSIIDQWIGMKEALYRDEANRELSQREGA